jgi:hypothetical protein
VKSDESKVDADNLIDSLTVGPVQQAAEVQWVDDTAQANYDEGVLEEHCIVID